MAGEGPPREALIGLRHGDGGLDTRRLVEEVFLSRFHSPALAALGDSAVVEWDAASGGRLAFTTDAFVVDPLFFPGGDIGRLAVCGTVNDLCVAGARPLLMSAAFVLEEGLALGDLERIADSMAAAAREAGVELVAGDTKVVQRGRGDKCFIATSGVGRVPAGLDLGPHRLEPGDLVLINGGLGEHGLAVLSRRPGLRFETTVRSDCAPLGGLVAALLEAAEVHFMRDPTRGGVAAALFEASGAGGLPLLLEEEALPVSPAVRAGTEVLGLDPLYLANEGKVLAVVPPQAAEAALAAMRGHPLGREARVIGRVLGPGEAGGRVLGPGEAGGRGAAASRAAAAHRGGGATASGDALAGGGARSDGVLLLRTALGPVRRLPLLSGEPLPRIC